MEEAIERSSLFEFGSKAQQVGDIAEGMAAADHKILSAEVHGIHIFVLSIIFLCPITPLCSFTFVWI